MMTHEDEDANVRRFREAFLDRLEERARVSELRGDSQTTGGRPGEGILDEWERYGVHVIHRPDDEQGVLRISIGGGDETPVQLNYCVFRGKHHKCVDLLRQALQAMVDGPEK